MMIILVHKQIHKSAFYYIKGVVLLLCLCFVFCVLCVVPKERAFYFSILWVSKKRHTHTHTQRERETKTKKRKSRERERKKDILF